MDRRPNTTVASDQLTIQYTNITGSPFSDCEGATVEINETVERYFCVLLPTILVAAIKSSLSL